MGVEVAVNEPGDGKTYPKSGDKLKMHYTGTLKSDGSKFDSSKDRNKLFEFQIGVGQVIKGWDEVVIQMSLGEIATLNISADFGYGAAGAGAAIPPNADLVFEVELVSINGKKHFYTDDEKVLFTAKMEEWKSSQLNKYDSNEKFKTKKDEKHGDKEAFEKFLTERVQNDIAAVKTRS
jgi:FK506-binding protein 1